MDFHSVSGLLTFLLNKQMGLSHERTAQVLELGYGLKWSRSGVCRGLERLGNLSAPTYEQLQSTLRQSPVVWLDDTGWRVGVQPQNLRLLWGMAWVCAMFWRAR